MADITVFPDPAALGDAAAEMILAGVAAAAKAGRPYVLGCPSGRSPRPVYQAMAARLAEAPQSLTHVRIAAMDEYLLAEGERFVYPPIDAHFSCRRFVRTEIAGLLNGAVAAGLRIPDAQVLTPDPADPLGFEDRIAALGGVDFFILASGASDGHIAFNPPGSARDSRTRILRLAEETRQDNMKTFPDFRSLDEVPTHGVSVGIATIADSKTVAMVVWGEGKRLAVQRLRAATGYEADWPASIVHECANAMIFADKAAAGA